MIGRNIGNYQIVQTLAEGGMGTVYLAVHPQIGKRVAVKVLHKELSQNPELVSRFFQEAKAVNEIGHPNIVDIVDFGGTDDGLVYLVMELLDGETLTERMRREPALSVPEALVVAMQVADALAGAHAKGIVHRDLKPDNVILKKSGPVGERVKLVDFGIAKLVGREGGGGHKTQAGLVMGTPHYMAPEQVLGRPVDWRADVWALGVLLYEMLTRQKPFDKSPLVELLTAVARDPAVPPSQVVPSLPPWIDDLVLRCLEKEPDQRPQEMGEIINAIRAGVDVGLATGAMANSLSGESPALRSGVSTALGGDLDGRQMTPPPMTPLLAGSRSSSMLPALRMSTGTMPAFSPPPAQVTPTPTPPPQATPAPQAPPAPSPAMGMEATMMAPLAAITAGARTAAGSPLTAERPVAPSPAARVTLASAGVASRPGPFTLVERVKALPQSPRGRKQLAIGGGGLLLLIILVAALSGGDKAAPDEDGEGAAVVAKGKRGRPPPAQVAEVTIETDPPQAEVQRLFDGAILGRAPVTDTQIADGRVVRYAFRLPGYADMQVPIRFDAPGPRTHSVQLNRLATPGYEAAAGDDEEPRHRAKRHKAKRPSRSRPKAKAAPVTVRAGSTPAARAPTAPVRDSQGRLPGSSVTVKRLGRN